MARIPDSLDDADPPPEEIGTLVREELRARGMSEAEIDAALRKKKRRKGLEFNAVHYRSHLLHDAPRNPNDDLLTVEFAAERLKLHPKTVLRFIHEARLKATRIGKSYRIRRDDLDAFAGTPARPQASVGEASVTSIVDIPGVGPEMAQTWARRVPAAAAGRPSDGAPLRVEVIYDPERSHLKLVLIGSPGETADLLSIVRLWLRDL